MQHAELLQLPPGLVSDPASGWGWFRRLEHIQRMHLGEPHRPKKGDDQQPNGGSDDDGKGGGVQDDVAMLHLPSPTSVSQPHQLWVVGLMLMQGQQG